MSWQQMQPRETNSAEIHHKYDSMAYLPGQKIYPEVKPFSAWRLVPLIISLLVWFAGLLFVAGIMLSVPTTIVSTTGGSDSPPHTIIQHIGPPYGFFLLLISVFLIFSAILLIINLLLYKRR